MIDYRQVRQLFRLTLALLVLFPLLADARKQDIRFRESVEVEGNHPVEVVVYQGQTVLDTLVLDPPDPDGIYTQTVYVPPDEDIHITFLDTLGEESPPSNIEVYGNTCSDWDHNQDGIVGGGDFTRFYSEYPEWNGGPDWTWFQFFWGQRC